MPALMRRLLASKEASLKFDLFAERGALAERLRARIVKKNSLRAILEITRSQD